MDPDLPRNRGVNVSQGDLHMLQGGSAGGEPTHYRAAGNQGDRLMGQLHEIPRPRSAD